MRLLSIFILILSANAYADSFSDLVYEVSVEANEPLGVTRNVMLQTFKVIENRMKEDRATSIPQFGRFYTQDKEKKSEKDKEGYWLSPRQVRTPKCSMAKELKNKLEKLD